MKKKIISVIIPVYNCYNYIEECLKSVQEQTISKNLLEVIIVNDGSTDNSESIIKKYIKNNKNWKYYFQTNKGLSETRNFGVKKCTGNYVFFLDGDDILPSTSLEMLYNKITSTNSSFVIGGMENFNSKGHFDNYTKKYIKNKDKTNYKEYKSILNCVHAAGKLYSIDAIKNINFIKNVKHEDNYYTLSLYFNCKSIDVIEDIVYYHRIREGNDKSITQLLNLSTFNDLICNYKKICDENELNKIQIKYFIKKSYSYIIHNLSYLNLKEALKYTSELIKKMNNFSKITLFYNSIYKIPTIIYLYIFKNK